MFTSQADRNRYYYAARALFTAQAILTAVMTIQAAQDRYYYAAQALFASLATLTDTCDDTGRS